MIDAFIELHVINTPMRHDFPPREAITRHMHNLAKQYAGLGSHIVAQIIEGSQADPEIRREFHERFHG